MAVPSPAIISRRVLLPGTFIILMVMAGVVFLSNDRLFPKVKNPPPSSHRETLKIISSSTLTSTPAPITTPSSSSISWKVYQDKQHHFEIQYPPTWEVAPDYRNEEAIGYYFSPKRKSGPSPEITIDFRSRRGVFASDFDYYIIVDVHKVGIHDLSNNKSACDSRCLYGTFIFEPGKEPKGWSSYSSGFELLAPDDSGKELLMQMLSTFHFLP